jgi:cell division protein FtsI/penicillin-binding protein 2
LTGRACYAIADGERTVSARENQRQKLLTRRAALLAAGQAVLGGALAARMYQLQILEKDKYAVMAEENRINVRLLAPPRGKILDRFGVALADNRPNYRVVVVRIIPDQSLFDGNPRQFGHRHLDPRHLLPG